MASRKKSKAKGKGKGRSTASSSKVIRVFFDGPAPTPYRSARLGVEVTLTPGVNVIDHKALAWEMIRSGVVRFVPDVHPNVTVKASIGSATHEPPYAAEGQGTRGDLEALRKTGLAADPGGVAAGDSAADAEIEQEADAARKREAAEGVPLQGDEYHPKVRPTSVQGTEGAVRADLSPDERRALVAKQTGHVVQETSKAEQSRVRRKVQSDAPVKEYNARQRSTSRPAPKPKPASTKKPATKRE